MFKRSRVQSQIGEILDPELDCVSLVISFLNLFLDLQSITFEQLKVQAGQDAGGIGTDMITMNATLRMMYRNTGTFFGVHVTSSPIDLSFSQITIGSGTVSPKIRKPTLKRIFSCSSISQSLVRFGWDKVRFGLVFGLSSLINVVGC